MTLVEAPSRLEPCLLDEARPDILDLVAELSRLTGSLDARLHARSAANLADLVRVMNCYHSNLIEGHNTRPRDIERALNEQFDDEPERRNLQLEARAHIRVQRQIDLLFAQGRLGDPTCPEFLCWLHAAVYQDATPEMMTIRHGERAVSMTPGQFRETTDEDVNVGRHIPPSSPHVAAFMAHFASRYRMDRLGAGSRIIAIPAAHHRLNYIHPFLDGNGPVSRLMSHAMSLHAGIGACGLWSISRGLARGLESRGDYKQMMDHAVMPRQGDLDGRGNLSRRALADFTVWFLKVCVDQVRFMDGLFQLDTLRHRLQVYTVRRGLKPEALPLLEQALFRGELPRGDASRVTGLRERKARDLLSSLVADGILNSDTPKGPVSLRFPLQAAEILFPSLFPQT
jgi:Fic family protein